jgi:hypothetical protein
MVPRNESDAMPSPPALTSGLAKVVRPWRPRQVTSAGICANLRAENARRPACRYSLFTLNPFSTVIAGFVPATQVLPAEGRKKDVDAP